MKILYIFPHPDDESFGPAAVINQQVKNGHKIYLYTMTKGEATKQRFRLNVDKKEMGEIRFKEMLKVKDTLGLTEMTVDDFPDNELKNLDPRILEKSVKNQIEKIKPELIITYGVHGMSGFHDHLVGHAVVKRVFCELKENVDYLKRLAFITREDSGASPWMGDEFRLKHSAKEDINCVINLTEDDKSMLIKCLNCYESYQQTIKDSGVIEKIGDKIEFEIFGESFDPPLKNLTDNIS